MAKLTWIPHLTQMGGFALGAEKAFGYKPQFVSTVAGFQEKDQYHMAYRKGEKEVILQPDDFSYKEKINVVVSNPPCAGLSGLTPNNTKQETKDMMNDFMIETTKQAILCYDADVVIGENAAALFTEKGKPVVEKLKALANEHGYAITLYKTDSQYYGIPQQRIRTFYILWKGKHAYELPVHRQSTKSLSAYLDSIPPTASLQDVLCNKELTNNYVLRYMVEKGYDVRSELWNLKSKQKNCLQWMIEKCEIDSIIEHYSSQVEQKHALHVKKKLDAGKNVWNDYPKIWPDVINGIIGKNMMRTLHPTKMRSLNIRECLHLMGFPHSYDVDPKHFKWIGKNVPVATAKGIVSDIIGNKLKATKKPIVYQDNTINNQNLKDFFK